MLFVRIEHSRLAYFSSSLPSPQLSSFRYSCATTTTTAAPEGSTIVGESGRGTPSLQERRRVKSGVSSGGETTHAHSHDGGSVGAAGDTANPQQQQAQAAAATAIAAEADPTPASTAAAAAVIDELV